MMDNPTHFEKTITVDEHYRRTAAKCGFYTWRCPEFKEQMSWLAETDSMTYREWVYNTCIVKAKETKVITPMGVMALTVSQGHLPEDALATHMWLEQHTFLFNAHGKQIFSVSKGLSQRLMETEVNAPCEALRLPYKSFYLEIPPGILEIDNEQTGVHKVEGVYVFEEDACGGAHRNVGNTLFGRLNAKGIHPQRALNLMVIGEGKSADPLDMDDALFFYTVYLVDGMSLSDCIDHTLESAKITSDKKSESTKKNVRNMGEYFRFVINTILYINSQGADRAEWFPEKHRAELSKARRFGAGSRKGKRCMERARKYSGLRKTVLGPGFEPLDGHVGARSWRTESRWRVRGHWRTYESERYKTVRGKTVWIEPFWKGPEMADLVDRKYKVKGAVGDGKN